MRMKRKPAHKKIHAKRFKHAVKRTKALNVAMAPQRGGWRL